MSLNANDLIGSFKAGLRPKKPWKDITEFVTSPKYLGYKPYPKQMTLLKLIFLETENMTAFDLKTIEEWRNGFNGFGGKESFGVQQDVWHRVRWLKENGYRRFPHIQNVMGRRGSKGWIGGILGAEQVAYMVSLDNWQKYYAVQPGKTCWISSIATNYEQAKKFQFADISQAINDCHFLKPYINQSNEHHISIFTPNDLRKIAMANARKQKLPDRDLATIHVIAMPAASSSGRGGVGLGNFYDEFAFMLNGTGGPADSDNVYSAYQPSLAQFKKDALTYIPSSPFTKVGKFYSLYQDGTVLMDSYLEEQGIETQSLAEGEKKSLADPTMLVYQNASWAIYEDFDMAEKLYGYKLEKAVIEFDSFMQIEKSKNPSKFKVEYEGQFAEVADAYLNPDMVDRMFVPFWGDRKLAPIDYGRMDVEYYAHIDPSTVNANFGFCIGHIEDAPEPDEFGIIWPHVIIDYLKVWKPEDFPDNTINYVQVGQELDNWLAKFPSMKEFSADQFNSAGILSALKEKYQGRTQIRLETATKPYNINRSEKFKSAINLGWIHSYRDNFFGKKGAEHDSESGSLLEQELKFLSEKNGEAIKQETGPVTTKDLADCVMSVAVRLLSIHLDNHQARMMGKSLPVWSGAGKIRTIDNESTSVRAMEKLSPGSARERMEVIAATYGNRGFNSGRRSNRWS